MTRASWVGVCPVVGLLPATALASDMGSPALFFWFFLLVSAVFSAVVCAVAGVVSVVLALRLHNRRFLLLPVLANLVVFGLFCFSEFAVGFALAGVFLGMALATAVYLKTAQRFLPETAPAAAACDRAPPRGG